MSPEFSELETTFPEIADLRLSWEDLNKDDDFCSYDGSVFKVLKGHLEGKDETTGVALKKLRTGALEADTDESSEVCFSSSNVQSHSGYSSSSIASTVGFVFVYPRPFNVAPPGTELFDFAADFEGVDLAACLFST